MVLGYGKVKHMKKIKFYLSIGLADARQEEEVEFPDDTTEQEINEFLEEWAADFIDMGYRELDE